MVSNHTATPWTYRGHFREFAEGHIFMERAIGACTIELTGAASMSQATLDAHGEFIVRACNNHETLLAALRAIADMDDRDRPAKMRSIARIAIAKATGEQS